MHVHLCDGGGCVRGLDTSIHKSSSPLLFFTMEENNFYGAFHACVYLKYNLQCLIITRNFQVLFLNTLKLRLLTRVYYMEINFFQVTFLQKVTVNKHQISSS